VITEDQAVLTWISENIDVGLVQIEDYPLFPAGKRLVDQTGAEMVVYFDLTTNIVKYKLIEQ
jgi:hypothetical protein